MKRFSLVQRQDGQYGIKDLGTGEYKDLYTEASFWWHEYSSRFSHCFTADLERAQTAFDKLKWEDYVVLETYPITITQKIKNLFNRKKADV